MMHVPSSNSHKSDRGSLKPSVNDQFRNKAAKRVVAPYLRIERKGQKKHVDDEKFAEFLKEKPSALLKTLSKFFGDNIDFPPLLQETADILKMVTNATGVVIYDYDTVAQELIESNRYNFSQQIKLPAKAGTTVSSFVALNKQYVMVDDVLADERFPQGVGWKKNVGSVLSVPVVTQEDDVFIILELHREINLEPFQENELKIVVVVAGWMGAAIHQNQQRQVLEKQQEINNFLLNITKVYFAERSPTDKLISEIIIFAKESLSAERGSFFIVDKENEELEGNYFEESISPHSNQLHRKKIRMKLNEDAGIAAHVAVTGELVNIKDAFNDPKFNKKIDKKSGYLTRSILCMPIMGIHGILGVVQIMNKKNGPCFSKSDENIFKMISVYCTLALHYMNLCNKEINESHLTTIYKEMLVYHMKPNLLRVHSILHNFSIDDVPDEINSFSWYTYGDDENIPKYVAYMLFQMIGREYFVMNHLIEFILMVQKSYRNNPYHNFEHALNVFHCMYNILKRNRSLFTDLEIRSLLIATICHDADHRGFTNNFVRLVNDPLAELYEESPLEYHHYCVTMILVNDYKLLSDINENLKKELNINIKHAILATDLANFFRSRVKITKVMGQNKFDWYNQDHIHLLKTVMMTACDLSGLCKPYAITRRVTDNLYREFYYQGDLERNMGLIPLSMMDKDKTHMIPNDQIQFITVVMMPCADILRQLLPSTDRLYKNCVKNRDAWKEIIDLQGQAVWKPEESAVKK